MPILAHLIPPLKWYGENTSPVKNPTELSLIEAGKLDPLDYFAHRGRIEYFCYQLANKTLDWRLSIKYIPSTGPSVDLYSSQGFKDLDEIKKLCESMSFRKGGVTNDFI